MSAGQSSLPQELRSWTCCPVCGGGLDVVGGNPSAHLGCGGCGREWYANPKPTASALIEDGRGRLLLGRRAIEPSLGMWDTPGGFLEVGEELWDGLARELQEECGITTFERLGMVGAFADRYGEGPEAHATINVFVRVRIDEPEAIAAADDVAELRWFAADSLPRADELAFPCVRHAVDEWLRGGGPAFG